MLCGLYRSLQRFPAPRAGMLPSNDGTNDGEALINLKSSLPHVSDQNDVYQESSGVPESTLPSTPNLTSGSSNSSKDDNRMSTRPTSPVHGDAISTRLPSPTTSTANSLMSEARGPRRSSRTKRGQSDYQNFMTKQVMPKSRKRGQDP